MNFLSSFCVQSYAQSQCKNMFYFRTTQFRPILEINFIALVSWVLPCQDFLLRVRKKEVNRNEPGKGTPLSLSKQLILQKVFSKIIFIFKFIYIRFIYIKFIFSNIKTKSAKVKGMDTVQLETSPCIPLRNSEPKTRVRGLEIQNNFPQVLTSPQTK